jgi:hypothetical protein
LWGMEAKPLLRPIDAAHRLGCGLDRFRRQYVLADPADPCIAGTELMRLEPVRMYWFWRGLRLCQLKKPMLAFVESEVDALATALKQESPVGLLTAPSSKATMTDDEISTHEATRKEGFDQ